MKFLVLLIAAAFVVGSASIAPAEDAALAPMPGLELVQRSAVDDVRWERSPNDRLPAPHDGLFAWTFTQTWKDQPMRIIIPLAIVWIFVAGLLYEQVVQQKKSELATVLAAVVLGGVILFLGAAFLAFK